MREQTDDLKTYFRNIFNTLARQYFVEDILQAESRFLFLLESPHKQELIYGAPVCGSSGASMTRHLFGTAYEKYPLGIIVKKNRDEALNRPSLNKIALMNVCQIPLQGSAYAPELHPQYGPFFRILEAIRSANNQTRYPNAELNIVQEIIVDRLRRKLTALTDRELYIVPCGRFAQKFFALAGVSSPRWQIMHGVPHPSYNNWSKPSYAHAVQELVSAFTRT
jgi:hypothetical protein